MEQSSLKDIQTSSPNSKKLGLGLLFHEAPFRWSADEVHRPLKIYRFLLDEITIMFLLRKIADEKHWHGASDIIPDDAGECT